MYGYDVDPTTWGHRTASLSPFWLEPAWSEGLVAAEPGALAPRPANSGERLLQHTTLPPCHSPLNFRLPQNVFLTLHCLVLFLN